MDALAPLRGTTQQSVRLPCMQGNQRWHHTVPGMQSAATSKY